MPGWKFGVLVPLSARLWVSIRIVWIWTHQYAFVFTHWSWKLNTTAKLPNDVNATVILSNENVCSSFSCWLILWKFLISISFKKKFTDIFSANFSNFIRSIYYSLPFQEPHPPINVTVTEVTQTSAVVSWEPPRVSNGDGAVDGYVVFAQLRNCLSTSCSSFLKGKKI